MTMRACGVDQSFGSVEFNPPSGSHVPAQCQALCWVLVMQQWALGFVGGCKQELLWQQCDDRGRQLPLSWLDTRHLESQEPVQVPNPSTSD